MPADAERPPEPDVEALTFEQAVEALEAIIERIEQGETGLEQSLAEYRRGAALLRRCRTILDAAEQQVEELTAKEPEDSDAAG